MKVKKRIMVFTEFYMPGFKGGGPIKTIFNLIDKSPNIYSFDVITSDRDLGDKSPYVNTVLNKFIKKKKNRIYYSGKNLLGLINFLYILFNNRADIIYLNSFFSWKYSLVPLLISKFRKKTIILGPRGEFSEGALQIKNTKKRLFLSVFNLLCLDKDIIFQASTDYEKKDIQREIGKSSKVFIDKDIASREYASLKSHKHSNELKLVFISRISPKKNLDYALKILSNINFDLSFTIFGPIEDKIYWKKCLRIIENLPNNIRIDYKGILDPSDVVRELSAYDLFFFPTKGENFGHVIAESLCAGVPLVISDTTPWRNLENYGIGYDIPLDDVDGFINKLKFYSNMSDGDFLECKKAALSYAKKNFNDETALKENLQMLLEASI